MRFSAISVHDQSVSEVSGWVHADNVSKLLDQLAVYTGARWDDVDKRAVTNTLPLTDSEQAISWFAYPISGEPQMLIHLANDIGTDLVQVRVEGDLDAVLAARCGALIDTL